MNTQKQVLIMSALLMLMLITVGIYGAWYPSRETASEVELDEKAAIRGSILFARNCRLCHGDLAEGGALGARLPAAPALDRADLQGFADSDETLTADVGQDATVLSVSDGSRFSEGHIIRVGAERMEVLAITENKLTVKRAIEHSEAESHSAESAILLFDEASLNEQINLITNTLVCGRVGTAMPAWAQSQAGPLSDEQIRQLMIVLTQGRWDLVEKEVDIEDRVAVAPVGLSGENEVLMVDDVTVYNEQETLRIGDERLLVMTIEPDAEDSDAGILTVERGVLGTTPLEHPPGEVIYRFPQAPSPSINQTSCGQTARPAVPAGMPELIEPFDGQTVDLIARNIVFDLDEIILQSGGQVRLRLDNQDLGVQHNIAVYVSENNPIEASPGSIGLIFEGPEIDDTGFDVPEVGSYFFRCDVHPTTMVGELIVE